MNFLLLPFVGELLVSLRRPIFYERTLIWTTLPYYLLLALGIEQLNAKAQRRKDAEPLPNPPPVRGGDGLLVNKGRITVGGLLAAPVALDKPNKTVGAPLAAPGFFRRSSPAAPVALTLVVALSLLALFTYYVYFQKEEWARAADFVAQQVQPGDVILFNATWVQLPFDYYFRHYNTPIAERGLPVDLFDRGILEPKMAAGDLPYMRELLAGQRRGWLVYSHDWYTDPQRIIPAELARSYQQVDHQEFVGLQIMRYEAK